MTKAKVFVEMDLVMDVDIPLDEQASEFEKQQHKHEIYELFESKLSQGFVNEKPHIAYFEFEIE